MKLVNFYRKPISMFVMFTFTIVFCFWANQSPAASMAPAAEKNSGTTLEQGDSSNPNFFEQEREDAATVKKPHKFPWLLVLGGAAVIAVIVFVLMKSKKYTLTVTVGKGVSGTPAAGATTYKKGTIVSYFYSRGSQYDNLVVTLDGSPVSDSGTITMNGDHTLAVSATPYYILIVRKGNGVNGTPGGGTFLCWEGTVVNYNYTLQSGCQNLVVTLDGNTASARGSVTMNSNHSLNASATIKATYINGVLTIKDVRYDMKAIPGGTFQMGSISAEAEYYEHPVHTVTISAFYMGKTEVTQGLWKAVMEYNPSRSNIGDTYPVEYVDWSDCQEFIIKLNKMVGGTPFRLPTEAQWEYACRAGTTDDRYGNIDGIAWYKGNSGGATHPVGRKQPNDWGLYDMLGNVNEWCQDWFSTEYYHISPRNNPTGPATGTTKIFRGGCWDHIALCARAPWRLHGFGILEKNLGFRLASGSAGK